MYKRSRTSKLKTRERQRQRESKLAMRKIADDIEFYESIESRKKRRYVTSDDYEYSENEITF